jgi:type I restriction enzyme M protein
VCAQRHLELPLLLDHGFGAVLRDQCYRRHRPRCRWRAYDDADLIARDKASLDIFWLKDDALADSDNLPPPEVIAQEIVDDLEAALEQFRLIAGDLDKEGQTA